jgi:hypothetical protein
MRNAKLLTDAGDHLCFRSGFSAKAVVDRGRFDIGRTSGGGEKQEREAVGPAGDRDPNPVGGWNEPIELGGKTADERGIRSSWRRSHPWRQAT